MITGVEDLIQYVKGMDATAEVVTATATPLDPATGEPTGEPVLLPVGYHPHPATAVDTPEFLYTDRLDQLVHSQHPNTNLFDDYPAAPPTDWAAVIATTVGAWGLYSVAQGYRGAVEWAAAAAGAWGILRLLAPPPEYLEPAI